MNPPSSFDRIAEFYDDDMGQNNPGTDIAFYASWSERAFGPVLELGCGTGRITIPLVKNGCRVVGVDNSAAMLAQLRKKALSELSESERRRLSYLCMDMRFFSFLTRFSLVLCPFSAFNYLLDPSDQKAAFERVHAHLAPDGLFILDTFIPQFDIMMSPDDRTFHDYERIRADGSRLIRDKTIRKDHDRQINEVCRTYRVIDPDGTLLHEISTREQIRYFFRSELELLLKYHGFTIVELFGDFTRAYSHKASTMTFVCRRHRDSFAGI